MFVVALRGADTQIDVAWASTGNFFNSEPASGGGQCKTSGNSVWASPTVLFPVCYSDVEDHLRYFYLFKVSTFELWVAWPGDGSDVHISDSRT